MNALKVFRMNDFDWVLSDLTIEETNEWYKKEFGLDAEDQSIDDVIECAENEGFWNECGLSDIIRALETSIEKEELRIKKNNGYYLWSSFKNVIESFLKENEYSGPFVLCSTEY